MVSSSIGLRIGFINGARFSLYCVTQLELHKCRMITIKKEILLLINIYQQFLSLEKYQILEAVMLESARLINN